MKLPNDPRLPAPGGPDYAQSLYQRLYTLFRDIAGAVNGIAEGRIASTYNAATAAPTKGEYSQGDFVRNSAPVDAGGYVVIGWVCVQSGNPGSWKEARCQTI